VAKLLPSAHAIEREFAVMGGLYGTDVPVPRMHLLWRRRSIIGRAFYVMEFVEGRVLWSSRCRRSTSPAGPRSTTR
jgi:aminoglycoside phosphotransferase (APT) family kinase protein